MSIENALAQDLRAAADDVAVPPAPDVTSLRDAADRRSRRRTRAVVLTGLVAAVVLTVLLIGFRSGRPDSAPPIAPTPGPSYYAGGTPYVQGTRLYINHQRQPGRWSGVVSAGPYSVAEPLDADGSLGGEVLALRDGRRLTTTSGVRIEFVGPVQLSAGGTIAWLVESPATHHGVVVARSLATGQELGRVDTGVPLSQGDSYALQLQKVLDDGTVYYITGVDLDTSWVWRPGKAPRRISSAAMPEVGAPPEGFPADVSARLSPDGLWGAWFSDADGRNQYGSITVQKPGDDGSRFSIRLPGPADGHGLLLSWLSPTVIRTFNGPDYTCDIVARRCTTQASVPE